MGNQIVGLAIESEFLKEGDVDDFVLMYAE
jgi:hypothetical protein